MSFFISAAQAQAAQPAAPSAEAQMFNFGFLILFFVLMWFLLIRPQRKQAKAREAMLGALQKGDEVVMTSGMLGRIRKLEDDYVVLQVAEGIELKFQRFGVQAVLPKGTLKEIGHSAE